MGDEFDILFVLRVSQGIMAEVETLRFLDLSAHPFAEVSVINLSLLFVILIDD